MGETVWYEQDGGVVTITLNRPERLNAMTRELLEELLSGLERAAEDESVRVVVVTGAGRGFCAGGDLGAIADRHAAADFSAEAEIRGLVHRVRCSLVLHEMRKPTIAAVNGACAGAGLSLACAADLRIAAESAVFRTAFLSAGMSGDFGGTWSLPRIVGEAKARELYFLNARLSAAEAADIGLVSRVVPDDAFAEAVRETAQQLASAPPLTLAWMKDNLNENPSLSLAEALEREARRHTLSGATEDAAEARQAFMDKREARFVGR